MSSPLQFDFTVEKASKTIYITREFDADLSLVWDAFTKAEILDQWWAPKPLTSKTKSMDFKVGGQRFYAMVSADGEEIAWQIQDYTSISPKTNFKFTSVLADKDGNPKGDRATWDLNFSEQNEITKVSMTILFDSLEHLEKMIEMGLKEGLTMTLNELVKLLSITKK